jgi:hypothetical protein
VLGERQRSPSIYVSDSAKAIQIAEAALRPVYGKPQVESERPFTANLDVQIWTVKGSLHCSDGKGGKTTHCVGGTAVVQISQQDGHVISIRHYK